MKLCYFENISENVMTVQRPKLKNPYLKIIMKYYVWSKYERKKWFLTSLNKPYHKFRCSRMKTKKIK